MPKLFTIEDLTKELYISRNTAYKLARQIKHNKIGRRILISETDLRDYLEKNSQILEAPNTKN
jgi:excisionase family DNA binding protein